MTPSNSASDLVAERLIDSGRLGTSDMVRLIAFQVRQLSVYVPCLFIVKHNLVNELFSFSTDMPTYVQRVKESIPETLLPYCCNGDELGVRTHQRAIVTTATCAGVLYMQGLHKGHFSHVLVDEAGQLTEPECLVPLG